MRLATTKLGEIAIINPSMTRGSAFADEHVAFVPMAAVSADLATITVSETRAFSTIQNGFSYFQDGDILVAKITPCFENGKIAQAHIQQRHGFGSTEFHVVRTIENRAYSRYLLHLLRQNRIRREGERKMTGSAGQRRVPRHFIEDLEIPLPPLEEQRRTAAILDATEALREKRRQSLAKLDTLTQSIFLDLFGDPVTNPRQWDIRKFSEVGVLDRGSSKHRHRNAPELLGGIHPLIQTGDVANCDRYIRSFESTYSDCGLRQSRMWPAGTLCITIAANIAKTGILSFDACFPDSVVGFKPNESVTIEYVQFWLSFLQATLEANAPESAQKNINLAILRSLDIPVPPILLQSEFAAQVSAVERLKTAQRASLAKLDALFGSLQHRAFRGEL
jgi:type I restriction enzyme, S subunit